MPKLRPGASAEVFSVFTALEIFWGVFIFGYSISICTHRFQAAVTCADGDATIGRHQTGCKGRLQLYRIRPMRN
jgi:hypothetical protein